jgi:hypothetical protein
MSWLQRLLRPLTRRKEIEVHHRFGADLQSVPDVMIGSSTVSRCVKANLRRDIELLVCPEKRNVKRIYEAALRSITSGRDLVSLHVELMKVSGLDAGRAAEIALSLNTRATAQINRERQASLGIIHAKWMYANSSCMRNPICPTAEDVE